MKLIFVGPQGSGKGTQAKIIAKNLNLCHISTGDLLRDAEGELKKMVNEYMIEGKLVPAEVVIKILKQRLSQSDCEKGFILDGFPRNLRQAEELDKIIDVDKVVEISIDDEESIRRISGRRNCKKCGMIYNVNTFPKPKEEDKCDKCGEELFQRKDDNEESLKKRLDVYHNETEPVLKHYNSVKIDGAQEIEKVSQDILEMLK